MTLPEDARLAADLAAAAYLQPDALRRRVQALGADETVWLEAAETQACAVRFGGRAWLVFRGTEKNMGDIVTDLKFRRKPLAMIGESLPGPVRAEIRAASVHRGFLEAWLVIRDQAVKALAAMRRAHPGLRLGMAGHSLGAALALLAAQDLAGRSFDVDSVRLFGCPRVGDRDFADAAGLGLDVVRFVNCCDIVPRVPFFAMGYRHTGRLVYFDRTGRAHADPGLAFRLADMTQAMAGRVIALAADGLDWSDIPAMAHSRVFTDHRVVDYQLRCGS